MIRLKSPAAVKPGTLRGSTADDVTEPAQETEIEALKRRIAALEMALNGKVSE